ncbi:MAG: thioredoxin family protein [SAR202 cluster bacterium]|nr:thioredoxin family protein [SAR202 cluster bacterium]
MGPSTAHRRLIASVIVALVAVALAGCGASPTATPMSVPAYSGVLAASEFAVGDNRVPFGLLNVDGEMLERANVTVRFHLLQGDGSVPKDQARATYRAIPIDTPHTHGPGQTELEVRFRGIYVVDSVHFDQPGIWAASFEATDHGGNAVPTRPMALEVQARPRSFAVGDRVPPTDNLTIHDAPFAELSTRQVERDNMHEVSVAEALRQGRPFVVVFASPAFCVSAMCGPVTEMVADVAARYEGQAHFIHIEPYDLRAAREQGKLLPAPVMDEWRLQTEPWVFVVRADGTVRARFEGLVTAEEVDAAVAEALASQPGR